MSYRKKVIIFKIDKLSSLHSYRKIQNNGIRKITLIKRK